MSKILFEDKVALRELNLPRKNTITAEDINEIKASVNGLYEGNSNASFVIDFTLSLEITFTAPYDLIIESQTIISGAPTVTYLVDETSYTFGNEIAQGSIITVSVDVSSVISLSISGENVSSIYFIAGYKHLGNSNLIQDDAVRTYNIDGNLLVFSNGQVSIGTPLSSNYAFEINNSDFAGGLLVNGTSVGIRGIGGSIGGMFEGVTGVQAYSSSGPAVQGISQGGGVAGFFQGGGYFETYGIGGSLSSSAAFEVNSETKGALIPRLTTTQRNSIPSPSTSLLIFNTTTNRFEYYNGTYWRGVVMRYLPIQFASWSPTDSQTVAFGSHPFIPVQASVSPNPFEIVMRGNGVIRGCDLNTYASGVVGTNEAWSLYVRHNGTDYLVQTISAATANRVFTNQSMNIPFVNGDIVRMIFVNPTWLTNNPTNVAGAGSLNIQ